MCVGSGKQFALPACGRAWTLFGSRFHFVSVITVNKYPASQLQLYKTLESPRNKNWSELIPVHLDPHTLPRLFLQVIINIRGRLGVRNVLSLCCTAMRTKSKINWN